MRSHFVKAPFHHQVTNGLVAHIEELTRDLSANVQDQVRMDTHCHDRNSDVPDETMGRLLRLPETWLDSDELMKTLVARGIDAPTVTNHNNARTCWEMLDRGIEILPAAEFSCTLPDFEVGVHVLTYGFNQSEEEKLKALRKDLYRFLEFTRERNIPTVLAHPLHFHSPKGIPDQTLMERFALLFERFEGLNGQRDSWQNVLTMDWVRSLSPEELDLYSKRHEIPLDRYCANPYQKSVTGGSDCHFGIFAGSTGTVFEVEGWKARGLTPAQAALEGLRSGKMAPFGAHCAEEKLTAALLDYFCQSALKLEDPGLIRLLLHKGTAQEKLTALLIGNGLMELRRHRVTTRFLEVFHRGLHGHKPSPWLSYFTHPDYRPLLKGITAMAKARKESPEALVALLHEQLPDMFHRLWKVFIGRIETKLKDPGTAIPGLPELLERFETPMHFRGYTGEKTARKGMSPGNVGQLIDGLPFPLLASLVFGGASYAAHHVLFDKRPFLDAFAERLGHHQHPKRILWLTDTLGDRNGVSHVLQQTLEEVRRRNLPIDFLAVDAPEELLGPHLHSLPATGTFTLPFYPDQPFRIPDPIEVQRIFQAGAYDRVISSTEAPMGFLALWIKHAFSVPAYFYVHTDWMDFAKRTLGLDSHQQDRVRRSLRAFYRAFDGVFVLNSEQKEQFSGPDFDIAAGRIHRTGHWPDPRFKSKASHRRGLFGWNEDVPTLLFAGRVSEEKGVRDLPAILAGVRKTHPKARLAFAGQGPLSDWLLEQIPDAKRLGWLSPEDLAQAYSSADLLILPSWFDTFSCVVLEAMACGLPVCAYASKGPRDLIQHKKTGYHARDLESMVEAVCLHLNQGASQVFQGGRMKVACQDRAQDFKAEGILDQLLFDMGMPGQDSKKSRVFHSEQVGISETIVV